MRFNDQLGSLVKNVSTELTLDEHQRLRSLVDKRQKPAATIVREAILEALHRHETTPQKSQPGSG